MDGPTYYKRAMWLPLVLLGVSSAILAVSDRWKGLLPHDVADNSEWVTLILAFAIVPYGIAVLTVKRLTRPASVAEYRMLAFATPLCAGVLLGVVSAVWAAITKGPDGMQLFALYLGALYGAFVGFPMVGLVELGYWLGRAVGGISGGSASDGPSAQQH